MFHLTMQAINAPYYTDSRCSWSASGVLMRASPLAEMLQD